MPRLTAYRQLPAWSPITASAIGASLAGVLAGRDARPALERLLLDRFEADGVRLYDSGTHALQSALAGSCSGNDDIVLLPAYTCYEVATAAVGVNARVALYDLDPTTLAPDVESVQRAAAGRRVASLVVAALYGMPIEWSRMRVLAGELGALLVEDAAQAHGTIDRGRPAGRAGDLTVLSFGRGKGWTGGGGGALLWRGAAGADAAARSPAADPPRGALERFAGVAAQWALARPRMYGIPASIPAARLGETIYHEPTPPRAMPRFAAALLLAVDAMSQQEADARRRNAADYTGRLATADVEIIGARGGVDAGALRYPLLAPGGWTAARATGAHHLGAGPPYPTPLDRLPALRPLLANPQTHHPVAERLVDQLITLPTHSRTTGAERAELARRVAELRSVGGR